MCYNQLVLNYIVVKGFLLQRRQKESVWWKGLTVLRVVCFNYFSTELFKVDSSMFKIGRLHFSCNKSLDYFDN